MFGEDARQSVKLSHLLVLRIASCKIGNRPPAFLFIHIAQEQSVMPTVLRVRRERRGRAPAQFEIQSKIANDFLREQTDEVRIAR